MIKPNRPSEKSAASSEPTVPKPHFRTSPEVHFHSEDEFSDWIDTELDLLEALFADFASRDSLRGYFSR